MVEKANFLAHLGVLVVEDQMGMRKIIKTVLQQMGLKSVLEAQDGDEAWNMLSSRERTPSSTDVLSAAATSRAARFPIDLIISDWGMPGMTGLELLRAVRSDRRFQDIPFVMLTAENNRNDIVSAVEAGVTDYVVKPFTPNVLEAKLRSILEVE